MLRHIQLLTCIATLFAVAALSARAETPTEAVGFFGKATGVIKSRAEDGTSLVLTVSSAEASENSQVKDTAPIVGKDLTLGTRMPKKDGVAMPHVDDVAWIKTLKAGDKVTVQIFAVRADPKLLRITKPGEKSEK